MSIDAEKLQKFQRLVFLKTAFGIPGPIVKTALYAPIPVTPAMGGGTREMLHKALMGAAMMGAVGMGLDALPGVASNPIGTVQNTMAKGPAFQGMLDASPNLRMQDPQKVKSMFNVLYQYFPAGAAEPYTASGIVESLMQYDRVDHKTVQDLLKMQKDYVETHVGKPASQSSLKDQIMGALPGLIFG